MRLNHIKLLKISIIITIILCNMITWIYVLFRAGSSQNSVSGNMKETDDNTSLTS